MSRNKKTLSQNTTPLNKNTQENLQKETLSLKSATLNENIQENPPKQSNNDKMDIIERFLKLYFSKIFFKK